MRKLEKYLKDGKIKNAILYNNNCVIVSVIEAGSKYFIYLNVGFIVFSIVFLFINYIPGDIWTVCDIAIIEQK